MPKVLLGCTGSVASIKSKELCDKLKTAGCEVQIVATQRALHFMKRSDFPDINFHTDEDEWSSWSERGDPVLHINLSKWADIFLIAPIDANTLGKLAAGMCDNLLTCCARAWDRNKPLVYCPAMNTQMYLHPVTELNISTLRSWGYMDIPVISKTLICGDSGLGAMAEVDDIVCMITSCLKSVYQNN